MIMRTGCYQGTRNTEEGYSTYPGETKKASQGMCVIEVSFKGSELSRQKGGGKAY